MPTITTTVTAAAASGVVTTQTTTEATPEPIQSTPSPTEVDALFAVPEGPAVFPAGEGQCCNEEVIVEGQVHRFVFQLQFPTPKYMPWLSGPIMGGKDGFRDLVTSWKGPLAAVQFDKDCARLEKMYNPETAEANEAMTGATVDQLIDYGLVMPVSMCCMKLSSGEWACYSPIPPETKITNMGGMTVADRLKELGAKSPYVLSSCLHHGDFTKDFRKAFPSSKTVFSSGFTDPTAMKGDNFKDIMTDMPVDFVIPSPRAHKRSTPVRDDTAALNAEWNNEIDFSLVLAMHSEEVCFIHKATKVLVTGDVWYSQKIGTPGLAHDWPAYPPAKDFWAQEFGDSHLAWRLWCLVHMKVSPNGLLADYWWGMECDINGFCAAAGMTLPEEHANEDPKTMLKEGWASVQKMGELDWEISLPSHFPAQKKEEAMNTALKMWQWMDTVEPKPFLDAETGAPSVYPPQPHD